MRSLKKMNLASNVTILIVLLITIFPFAWMILTSLKTQLQITSSEHFFRFTPTMANYRNVLEEQNFLLYMLNSFIVAFSSVFLSLVIGLPAAYGVAKYNMNKMGMIVLIVKIIPGIMFLVPWFIVFSQLRMIDTHLALILTHMLIGLPYIVWIMISYFESLPVEIQESGLIDGCTGQGVFVRIILPVAIPGIFTSFLLAFISSWNHFLFSVILSGSSTKTLPVAIFNFISYAEVNWGAIMAAACLVTMPVLLISLFTQRFIVSGMSAGAVKG